MLNNQKKEIALLKDLGMLYPTEFSKKKVRFGLYKCYCGNEFKARIYNIKNEYTKSCGCLNKSIITTHGRGKHKLYNVWIDMIRRCNNENRKNYKNYGGRGITVCERWLSIENFIEDMYPSYQEGLTLDRRDNDGNYEPSNCRWTNRAVQNTNKRKIQSNNKSGYKGVYFKKTLKKWASGISINSKSKHLGYFNTALEAAKIYDKHIMDNNLIHTKNFE